MNAAVGQFRPSSIMDALSLPSSFVCTSSLALETSAANPKLYEVVKVQCLGSRDFSVVEEEKRPRPCSVPVRRGLLSVSDCLGEATAEQVTELRKRIERGLTRRSLLALPAAAAATLLVSPSSASVSVQNRAPSENFLLRTFGVGDPDIYYPRFFEGTWNCYSTLIAVETPQGEEKIDVKSVEQSRTRLGYTSLLESIIGKNIVVHGTWDPRQPNRLELALKGGAKVESTVTKRSAGMFSSYEFESAEFSRQVLDNFSVKDGPPTVKASQNLTRYQWDITADDVSKIEAIQKVSMYAVPQEGKDFELEIFNSTRPIAIYKYRITFERPGL